MKILSVKLTNFRNHVSKVVYFDNNVNFLVGGNAHGKTNILEAIYFFAQTKSFQTSKEIECINEKSNSLIVEIEIERKYGNKTLKMIIDRNAKKSFFINDEKIGKQSKLFGELYAVLFTPTELKIVKGSPENRRMFVDNSISELSGNYYELLNNYEKILFQRNRALKRNENDLIIDVFDEQFAHISSRIIYQRSKYIEKINEFLNTNMNYLSNGKETLSCKYQTNYIGSAQDIYKVFLQNLKENRQKDRELGFSSIGPHRDDILIEINGKDSKIFASQGQSRTIVLALKISEYELLKKETGEEPVLLLDDVFSELDVSRSKLLFQKTADCQTIITGTRTKKANFLYKTIKI